MAWTSLQGRGELPTSRGALRDQHAAVGQPAHDLDLELARRAAHPEARSAQRDLVERLFDRVQTTVTYVAGHHRDVDDFVQLSLLEILRSLPTYRGESRLEAWADRITVRTTRRALGRRARRDRRLGWGVSPPESALASNDPGTRRWELRWALSALLQRIPADRRIALVLRWVYHYSIAEIAEMTDARPNTVRDRLQVGMRQVRKMLVKRPDICNLLERGG